MRSIEDIKAYMADPKVGDIFGAIKGDLMEFLPFEDCRPYLKDDVTEERYAKLGLPKPLTREIVIGEIVSYMPFAWEKANGCRGLSAGRSLSHMQGYLWLLGADEAVKQLDTYGFYGKPHLRGICEALNIDWTQWDDGRWTNDELDDGHGPVEGTTIEIPA